MNIIIFTHPKFLQSQSMPRFANILYQGMQKKGHNVEIWTADAYLHNLPGSSILKKWFGYIDQYLFFPLVVKRRIKHRSLNTLFVFSDHALGPWVSLVKHLPHVIHCHDFLAQRSAKRQIPENITSFTGIQYQKYIHRGYSQGENFISVSQKTQNDLLEFLPKVPTFLEVVYNSLNPSIISRDIEESKVIFQKKLKVNLADGYILHVGGNQWYKNRKGVIYIYNAWRNKSKSVLPLILIGSNPTDELAIIKDESIYKSDIHFIQGVDDDMLNFAYSGAIVLLFPSLAEGFGWPIAEAMECNCPVITTNEAPMTEVAGDSAFLIPKLNINHSLEKWSEECAIVLDKVINLSSEDRESVIKKGKLNVERFKSEYILAKIETIYNKILHNN